jgi:hypothetical protein
MSLFFIAIGAYFIENSVNNSVELNKDNRLQFVPNRIYNQRLKSNFTLSKPLQKKNVNLNDSHSTNNQKDTSIQIKKNGSTTGENILSYLKLNDINLLSVQTPNISCLTANDKLFCEKLLDTLHINFINQLAAKPQNIDSSLIVFKYKNQLNTYARKQLIYYNFNQYNNDKMKTLALREYFELLKEQEFQRIKKRS